MSRLHDHRRHPRHALLGAVALLTTASPLGLAGVGHAEPATPTTCQGEPATMVVDQESNAVGTEGRDVVVAVGSAYVRTLGGDDLVCVIGTRTGSNSFNVDAGDGNDVVDTTQKTGGYYGTVDLGPGSDRFVGGAAHDGVNTDGPGSAEDGHVVTGSGDDSVVTGTPGHPNGDTVDLGEGYDAVSPAGTVLTGPALAGGAGSNALRLDGDGSYAIDNVTGTGTRDGLPWARWTGFDSFSLWESRTPFTFTGSGRPESVSLGEEEDSQPRFVDLAGGDDSLSVYSVTGSAGADRITVTGCRLEADGRGGPDAIRRMTDWIFEEYSFDDCRSSMRAVFRGGAGRDDIRGSLGNDRLYGGRGRDRIDGWSGRDLCRAEKKERCER